MATITLVNREIKVAESLEYIKSNIRENRLFVKLTENKKFILINKNHIITIKN